MNLIRKLIRTDGTEEELIGPHAIADICQMIGADTLDTVILRHLGDPRHVMIVDDTGMIDGRPINAKATELYRTNCRPGTTFGIHGDVVVVPDSDYAELTT